MEYCIKNNNGLFIKLNGNGSPVTCQESKRQLFEYSKACNICGSLPKTFKKLNFFVEAVPEEIVKKEVIGEHNNYEPSENVTRWINKLGQCGDVINEASQRNEELNGELSTVDLRLQDILHNIENTDKFDMFSAWKIVNEIRDIRRERRQIKDERLILSGIKSQGITYLNRESVQKCVDGLATRKYKLRIVEEDECNEVV